MLLSVRGKSLNAAAVIAVRAARLGFAAFGIAAVVAAVGDTTGSLVNFFSFFTIESNLMAIVVLLAGAALDPRSRRWAWIRGAVTLYMVVTMIVYAALLANAEVGLTAAWVNSALHQVLPAVLLVDWLCFPPWPFGAHAADAGGGGPVVGGPVAGGPVVGGPVVGGPVVGDKASTALVWLAFPLGYLAYSLARGAAVDWYPYPFLDPRHPGGYGRVALYCVVLAALMALLALGIAAAGRWRAAYRKGPSGGHRGGRSPAPAPGG
jgi:hypothetical protein